MGPLGNTESKVNQGSLGGLKLRKKSAYLHPVPAKSKNKNGVSFKS